MIPASNLILTVMSDRSRISRFLLILCRLVLATVFLFSGFVKGVDPWGTAIKMGDYFTAWGIVGLEGVSYGLSIALSAFEMLMGFALLFGLRLRLMSVLVLLFMTGFTGLTLWIALANPVSDCGCFGDAVKLTNWQTFYKNLILLPMSVAVCAGAYAGRRRPRALDSMGSAVPSFASAAEPSRRRVRVEWLALIAFACVAAGVGVYSLRHLPILDFLPYKVGVSIPEAMNAGGSGMVETTLIYRDRASSAEREFSLSDTTWYDTTRWEYVDTRIVSDGGASAPAIRDFHLFREGEDVTGEVLADPGAVFLFCATRIDELTGRCAGRFAQAVRVARASGARVLCATTSPLGRIESVRLPDGMDLPCYNIDGTTLKTMLRARNGLVLLRGGTIAGKWNCRDIPQDWAPYGI